MDDVSSTLKRFFRELKEGMFTSEDAGSWLSTAGESQTVSVLCSVAQLLISWTSGGLLVSPQHSRDEKKTRCVVTIAEF